VNVRLAVALLGALVAAAAPAQITPIPWHPRQSTPPPAATAASPAPAPADTKQTLTFDEVQTPEPGLYLARGRVRFARPGLALTCDALTYDSNAGTLWATGGVTVDFEGISLSGTELHYDLNAGTGEMRDAYATEASGLYVVQGSLVRKTGKDWYEVEDGVFTSCNSAEPPWSIRLSRARLHVDHYAFLTNPRFKVRAAPVFYLPYLVWPVKPDRTTGLLLPNVGRSSRRGYTTSNALFLAPSDWWDDTVYFDTYQTEGIGIGEEFRYALTPQTYGWLHGYFIDQNSDGRKRWDFAWTHVGRYRNGWQSVADVNLISDADFWRDYQRDYFKSTQAAANSRLFLTRQWGPYSLNLRAERLLEYYSYDEHLTQSVLPGIEWRSSLQPLGRGFYAGWETSADLLDKGSVTWDGLSYVRDDLRYRRVDLHPFFEWPLRTVPWLDVTPRLELRATGYSRSLDAADGSEGGSLWRQYAAFSLRVAGPRIQRRFASGLKHVVEPFAEWTYVTDDSDVSRIPVFDQVDQVDLDQDLLRYGVRNRVYTRGFRMVFDSELYQSRSAREPLSSAPGDSSRYSPVTFVARAWPSKRMNVELRLRYDVLAHAVDSRSLSVNAATADGRLWGRLGYLESKRLGVSESTGATTLPSAKEVSVASALKLWKDRLSVDPYIEYDLLANRWRNARVVLWYRGSCYAIGLEAGRREIGDFRDTQIRLLVRLKNVGSVVDLAAGSSRYGD